ncbi:MAG: EamA family transporter [Candidatus Xenobiia bacterium LiM19]
MSTIAAIGLVILGTLIGSWGALLFKKASVEFSFNPLKIIKNWKLLLGGFLYFASTIPFIIAIKYGELSLLYPFVSVSYIWVALLSMFFLKEKMNRWTWSGIFLIIAGVCLIGMGRS